MNAFFKFPCSSFFSHEKTIFKTICLQIHILSAFEVPQKKELVPVTVPQKGASSRNVSSLNEFLERTAGWSDLVITRGTPGPSPGLIEAANFVAAHLQILKRILVLHLFTQ